MFKVYNNQKQITSSLEQFLQNNISCLHKPQIKLIPAITFGMISSESVVTKDIAINLKDEFSQVQLDSVTKRIRRLLNNPRFNGEEFYNEFISYVIDNYKIKHSDSNNVHLSIDHMYCKDNYTVLLVSMRIGKQGIPIYFKCFKGINEPEAFKDKTIINVIDNAYKLFKDKGFNIIFLADRWFNSKKVLQHIDSIGAIYCFRLKGNIKIAPFDLKVGHRIKKYTEDLTSWEYHSLYYNDVYMYDNFDYSTNIAVSRKCVNDEPWIIATNGNPKDAIKHYSHRFGSIETIFKNQKSNGFYLEDICTASLKSFTSLYSLVCFSIVFLTILGADYCKNSKCYKNVKITTHKNYKNKGKVRVMSLFNTGLTLFKLAFNSLKYIRIPYNMILYDV